MPQLLAVFDLDDTLISGDSSAIWTEFLWEKGIITDPSFIEADEKMMADYNAGILNMNDYLAFSLQTLHQVPLEQVDVWLTEFVKEKIRPRFYPQAKALLEKYQQQQVPVMIISATVSFIVKKIAAEFGIHTALGIDMVIENGCYTSKIDGIATFREGKVKRMKQWLKQQNSHPETIRFYSDSINDLPMCQFADEVITVNADTHLQAQAEQHGWKQLTWSL
ncbi:MULTISPECIES: HAD family phosphatase [Photorhabdus]|uniref:HAD family hydrolase n=1 Tax=Photorhabdus thracensis TaxID=230089 RepID=A0A0F7LJR9_9GAMM|nr:HAD family hydrolase [Photorhabdus thracensis]AKH62895.1 HAD family hydrolase [Photorhabdus thracensis]MCC8422212.1 HAD family hydrolase [Photorhabdus thracensis]